MDLTRLLEKIFRFSGSQDDRRRARIFVLACTVELAATCAFILYYGLFDPSYNISPMFGVLVAACVCFEINRRGFTTIAGNVILWSTLVGLVSLALFNDGIYDSALQAIPAMLIIAALILGKRDLVLFSVACLISPIVCGVIQVSHLLQYRVFPSPSYTNVFDFLIIDGSTVILVILVSAYLRDTLTRAKEGEERYRTLFNSANDAIITLDRDRFLECNSTTERIFMHSREQLIGHSPADFSPERQPDGRLSSDAAREKIDAAFAGIPQVFEWTHLRSDATPFHAEVSLNRVLIGGKFILQAIVRDITERKQAEQSLRDNQELLSLYIRQSPAYTYIKEVTPAWSRVVQASDSFERMIGMAGDKMIGKTMSELFPPDLAAKMTADDWDVVSHGSVIQREEELNGRIYTTTKFPIVQGERTLLAGFTIDITDRKRIEKALADSEHYYRSLIDASPDAIVILDQQGNVLFNSQKALDLLRLPPDQSAIGKPVFQWIAPESRDEAMLQFRDVMAGRAGMEAREYAVDRCDGERIWVEIGGSPLTDEHGTIEKFILVCREVTERRKNESERRTLHAQLMQSQRMESIGTLAAGIAHDFNNILNIIIGNSELLAEGDLDEKARMRLQGVSQAAMRAAHLVKQLLTFARKTESQRVLLSVEDIIDDTMRLVAETFPKNIIVRYEAGAGLPKVFADPHQMHQVVMNLSVNARDAMQAGGTLSFRVGASPGVLVRSRHEQAKADQYVVVTVQDTGAGMDEKTIEKIFDPFFTTKEIGKGTGLGMSVVKGIVDSHHGFIDVHSRLNEGTRIQIFFPVSDTILPSADATYPRARSALAGHETLLLLEDEEVALEMLAEYLIAHGYAVLRTGDGAQGIELFRMNKGRIDLVVSDFGLPNANGEEVFRRIQQLEGTVPFLLMSGYLEPEKQKTLLGLGIKDIISKPFTLVDFLSKIRSTLDSAPVPLRGGTGPLRPVS